MSAGEEKTAHVAKKNGGEDLRRRTGVHGGGDDRGADGDVPGELGLEIDGVGGEVDVTGVENDVVVRVAHAWERESGAAASGMTKRWAAAGGHCLNRRGGGAGSRAPRTLAEELLGAETVDLVHDDGGVHLGALIRHGDCVCWGGGGSACEARRKSDAGRSEALRLTRAAGLNRPPGRGDFHLFSPAVGPSAMTE